MHKNIILILVTEGNSKNDRKNAGKIESKNFSSDLVNKKIENVLRSEDRLSSGKVVEKLEPVSWISV